MDSKNSSGGQSVQVANLCVFFHGLLYFNSEMISTNNDPPNQRLGLSLDVEVVFNGERTNCDLTVSHELFCVLYERTNIQGVTDGAILDQDKTQVLIAEVFFPPL